MALRLGARASRVLASASRDRELLFFRTGPPNLILCKACFGATPKPTRGTRMLPRIASHRPLV
jgi:hypothetical protein